MAQQVQGNGRGDTSQDFNADLSYVLNEDEEFIGGKYRILEDLGVSGYSRVILASNKHVDNDELVAIRVFSSDQVEQRDKNTNAATGYKWEISNSKRSRCHREIDIMSKIKHENVVKLIEVIGEDIATFPQTGKDGKAYYAAPCSCVVFEYCSKGELFDYLMYGGGLGSRVTRTYFHQLLNGLKAMHDAGYVHRDLKPENLLLDDQYNLKISSFQLAAPFKDDKGKFMLASTCGTRGYLAPELIKHKKYTNKVDYFAVGIIMFTTFAGFPPFQHAGRGDWWWDKMNKGWQYWQEASALNKPDEKAKKQEKISKGNKKMKLFWAAHERSCKFGNSFKHLMQYLLCPNPNLRYGIKECFEHPWLKGKTLNNKNLRKAMKKFSEKVDRERKKKIQEQLKMRGMTEVAAHLGNRKTHGLFHKADVVSKSTLKNSKSRDHGLFDKDENVVDLENTLKNQNDLAIARNTAILNKSRFQILSDKKLKDICNTIEAVTVSHGTKLSFTKNAGEFLISTGVSCSINEKEFSTKSEKIEINVKIVYEKNASISNRNGDNDPNRFNNTPYKPETNDDKTRFYVVFWAENGSQDGVQPVMTSIFYDARISGLLILDCIDSSHSNNDAAHGFLDKSESISHSINAGNVN